MRINQISILLILSTALIHSTCIDDELELLPFVSIIGSASGSQEFNSFEAEATLSGLEEGTLDAVGFVYSAHSTLPAVGDDDSDTIVVQSNFTFVKGQKSFTGIVRNLVVPPHKFNVRAFIHYQGHYVYSDNTVEITISDGWQRFRNESKTPLREIIAEVIADQLYFGVGCGVDACDDFTNTLAFYRAKINDSAPPQEVAPFPGLFRRLGICFKLNGSLYYGLGENGMGYLNDFWKYTPDENMGNWEKLSDFPNAGRSSASVFVIDGKAYIGLGLRDQNALAEWYEFDGENWNPILDESIPNVADLRRYRAISFTYKNKGYIMFGRRPGELLDDIWEFDPIASVPWRSLGTVSQLPWRDGTVTFQIADRTFIGLGRLNNQYYNDLWEFKMNDFPFFSQKANLPVSGRAWSGFADTDSAGFLINGLGRNQSGDPVVFPDIWKYVPDE